MLALVLFQKGVKEYINLVLTKNEKEDVVMKGNE